MPAAAVIRRVQALPGLIGRKEFCRQLNKLGVKYLGSTEKRLSILFGLEVTRG